MLLELTVAERWFLVAMALREKERLELEGDAVVSALAGAASAEGFIKLEVRDPASCERALALVRFVMAPRAPS